MNSPSKASPELELKFQVRPAGLVALRASSLLSDQPGVTLQSVYYDTARHSLYKAGFSLRVRKIGGKFVQTVKSRAGSGLFDRDEWESEIKDERPDRFAWLGTPIARILRGARARSLVPIFTTNVARSVLVLKEGNSEVEVSLDEGAITSGTFRDPISELELELKSGDVATLFDIARRFSNAAVLTLSFESKAERGYRLGGESMAAPRKADMVKLAPGISATEAVRLVVRACMSQIAANAELLRRAHDSEALHQLRIGVRRMRAAFGAFGDVLPSAGFARMRREAKWLGSKLDGARNLDVVLKTMARKEVAGTPKDPITDTPDARMIAARAAAYGRVMRTIDSKRFAKFLLDCAIWVEVGRTRKTDGPPTGRRREKEISIFAVRALNRLRRQVSKKGKHLRTLDPDARHRLRIKAKNLRYAVEFFAESFGRRSHNRSKKFLAKLEALQEALGDLNDMSVAGRTILAVAGSDAEKRVRARHLVAARTNGEAKLLANAVDAYKKWRRARPFWREAHK